MNTNSTYLKRYSLPAYLILTPLISNAIALFLPLPTVGIALLMVLVPVIMAILLTALAEGRRSLVLLLKKLFQWRISLTWYATALLMPMGIILTAVVLAFLFGWTPTIQFNVPEPSMLITYARQPGYGYTLSLCDKLLSPILSPPLGAYERAASLGGDDCKLGGGVRFNPALWSQLTSWSGRGTGHGIGGLL
ncbi:MAG: hypothetical protein P8Y14_09590 [Anaerolineales bacterium]